MHKRDIEFKYLGSCPVCSSKFEPRMATVVSRQLNAVNIYAQCIRCKSSISVLVKKNAMGFVTTVGMLTDMTKKDIERIKTLKPISVDDVIEIHKILES